MFMNIKIFKNPPTKLTQIDINVEASFSSHIFITAFL